MPPEESFPPLVPYGWDERVATLYASVAPGPHQPGRVVGVERGWCTVQCAGGPRSLAAEPPPAVGDWVALGPVRVEAVLERRSALCRQDPDGRRRQVLAANLDVILVVAPADRLHLARVERELLVAWESGAVPVVVVTKTDLVEQPGELATTVAERLAGVEVVSTSAVTGEGVGDVGARLRPHRSAALLGPSGSGKSSLANTLVGEEVLATGDVRTGDRRGRHTTTSRRVVLVPGGGVLVDTPGLRSLAPWGGDGGLAAAFADIDELGSGCRFRDCRHDHEPQCAVVAAVAAGELDGARLRSYRKLERELAYAARADDPQARRAEEQRWKGITKAQRRARRW